MTFILLKKPNMIFVILRAHSALVSRPSCLPANTGSTKVRKSNTIFPSEGRGWRNRRQYAIGRYTEDKRAEVKNCCKLVRGVKAKGRKQTGVKQGLGYWGLLAIELRVLQYRYICGTCGGLAVETAGRSSCFLGQIMTKG